MGSFSIAFALISLWILCLVQGDRKCDEEGVCHSVEGTKCGLDLSLCQPVTTSTLYRHGGVAQAYKARAPVKTNICDLDSYKKYKVALWPFSRSTRSNPPRVKLRIHLWSCISSRPGQAEEKACCCRPLDANALVEVWQARPDGTYSSLREGVEEGECRARWELQPTGSPSVVFDTVAPGSTGALAGLGPSKWDLAPFGIPVIHVLATARDHNPVLIDLPVLINRNTLEQRTFYWPDWRGASWARETVDKNSAYVIEQWTANVNENSVHVDVSLFLARNEDLPASLQHALCPSRLYGSPSSFFLEPITMCAPSLLDFFAM